MDMIGRTRRLHARDKLSEREIARMAGLSRNTVSKWLHAPVADAPKYRREARPNKQGAFETALKQVLVGVVSVPLFLVVDDIVSGKLCAPFGPLAAMQRSYFANMATGGARNPIVDSFFEWLLREGRDTEESINSWARNMGWQLPPPA